MKKFGQIVLVFLLSVGMFTGCGTSYKADESTVFVLKDGKIVSTDVENFDEKTYDKDGLKEYVKNEIEKRKGKRFAEKTRHRRKKGNAYHCVPYSRRLSEI